MKKITFFALAIMIAFNGFTQSRAVMKKELRDRATINVAPIPEATNSSTETLPGKANLLTEELIGNTWYDLQTWHSMQSRMYLYPDGFIGATFTYGNNYPDFPDLGTGYNSFDGSSWGIIPFQRIENDQTSGPSYNPWGQTGELIVASYSDGELKAAEGLVINTRQVKGTGIWTGTELDPPIGLPGLRWPSSATGGSDNSILHILANTDTIYQGIDYPLLYSRSVDGGNSWEVENVILPDLDSTNFWGFWPDAYKIITQGDNVAVLVGIDWSDLVLLKSSDNGSTWSKIVVWEHPYPLFDYLNPILTDTLYSIDASFCLAFDNTSRVHIAFGITRILSDESGLQWFRAVDGIGYWNEDMPVFSNNHNALNPYGHPESELIENYNLVGWSQDINGNGTLDVLGNWGGYYCGFSSMPQLVIDETNNGFLVFSSPTEGYDNGSQTYRHLWTRGLNTNGQWGDFVDLNADPIYNSNECVYPSCSPTTDSNIHLIYQRDTEPGNALGWYGYPWGLNYIDYMSIPKEDIINDTLSGGFLIGTITDAISGLPLQGATVTLMGTGYSAITASDGTFEINNIVPGYYTLKFSKEDYLEKTSAVLIEEGIITTKDLQLLEVFEIRELHLKVFLEGPFVENQMVPYLNLLEVIPLVQPYNAEPWIYGGNESVIEMPNSDIVDWILVEIRKTTGDVTTATADSTIAMQACFIKIDGTVVGMDGISPIQLAVPVSGDLYVVVWPRNHLGVMSNFPLIETNGVYDYDFTTIASQTYGSTFVVKELDSGAWGVMSGEGVNDTHINNKDKDDVWVQQYDSIGYYNGDFNMDGQVSDPDKQVYWEPNSGMSGMVPGGHRTNWNNEFFCGYNLIDTRDGQTYNTVQIGDQCWMAENLNIGSTIPGATNMTDNGVLEKYCYEDNEANCYEYGGLYSWGEVMQYTAEPAAQGICPEGWHVPTDGEWCTLENYVDAGSISCDTTGYRGINAGGNLKETGFSHWNYPNTGATNSSGFTALPGGARDEFGIFNGGINIGAYFWTSSENGSNAWGRKLHYLGGTESEAGVRRLDYSKYGGDSIRCLKD